MSLISRLLTKLRAVITDNTQTGSQTYTASGRTFIIAQSNVASVSSVTVNGTILNVAVYDYDSTAQEITIDVGSVVNNDAVIISYIYNKYSDTELTDYLRSALVYMDVYSYVPHFDISSGDTEIYPIPEAKEQNLVIIIASILIKPEYSGYRTPTVQITYPRKMTKEERIEQTIKRFKRNVDGVVGIINLNGSDIN